MEVRAGHGLVIMIVYAAYQYVLTLFFAYSCTRLNLSKQLLVIYLYASYRGFLVCLF